MDFTATDNLMRLVGTKHDLLVQLRNLGLQQLALIDAGDLTQLLRLLASKQRLLAALQAAERQLDPFRRDDPQQRTWRDAAGRGRCAEMADQCQSLLNEVLAGEKLSESRMRLRRDEAATRLQGVHQATQARFAYHQPAMAQESRQLDLSSGT